MRVSSFETGKRSVATEREPSTTHAQSVLFTYDQWAIVVGLREIYLAGAIDGLSTTAVPAQANTARHYNECFRQKQIAAHQVSEGISSNCSLNCDLSPATEALLVDEAMWNAGI